MTQAESGSSTNPPQLDNPIKEEGLGKRGNRPAVLGVLPHGIAIDVTVGSGTLAVLGAFLGRYEESLSVATARPTDTSERRFSWRPMTNNTLDSKRESKVGQPRISWLSNKPSAFSALSTEIPCRSLPRILCLRCN
eukprot:CAMPEP_0117684164 /NCGR_PEP_ID=MMETSP0804-20121206/20909_1 /TAXON_ID=1074897 /ORGANISM="Tetraselmis astigmatica, Strain CCMP880" /LENGTH=135 /DNA_ID=CAMNT_0005495049 /DNA_START=419 /DNA_END=823 /DNA_ORIENTATION=+